MRALDGMTIATGQREGKRIRLGLPLALAVVLLALLALGAGPASAAPASGERATGSCWKDVVNDWLQHQPNVVGTYPIPCYTQAIQHLDQYPDIQQYSNAPDDIHRAMLAALRNNRGGPGSGSGVGPTSGPGGGSGPSDGPGGSSSGGSSTAGRSFFQRIFDAARPGSAQSVPLPLLVLGGVAVLLLLAAAGTWIAKRLQARRMTPAPAPAPRRR